MKVTSIFLFTILLAASCHSQQSELAGSTAQSQSIYSKDARDTATFGEGCFWCIEPIYTRLKGVDTVIVGFSGGDLKEPTYQEVSTGTTGNAEVAQIVYNPSVLSFKELLKVFWSTHDPTTVNRQNADTGTQYRSVIFYHNLQQKEAAELYKKQLEQSGTFSKPIVTEIAPFKTFYPAGIYHQQYYKKNPDMPYSLLEIKPRLKKFEMNFKSQLKSNSKQ